MKNPPPHTGVLCGGGVSQNVPIGPKSFANTPEWRGVDIG